MVSPPINVQNCSTGVENWYNTNCTTNGQQQSGPTGQERLLKCPVSVFMGDSYDIGYFSIWFRTAFFSLPLGFFVFIQDKLDSPSRLFVLSLSQLAFAHTMCPKKQSIEEYTALNVFPGGLEPSRLVHSSGSFHSPCGADWDADYCSTRDIPAPGHSYLCLYPWISP